MPTPNPILKLYRTNNLLPGQAKLSPDLVISASGAYFILGGTDAPTLPAQTKPWPYVRLELFSEDTGILTFAIPTLDGDINGFLDISRTRRGASTIAFKCHMLLLNGEVQPKQGGDTTTGFSMRLYRKVGGDPGNPQWTTFLEGSAVPENTDNGSIGDTGWTSSAGQTGPPYFGFALSEIDEDWFKQHGPQEKLFGDNKTPGPLLEAALGNAFPPGATLQFQLLPGDSPRNTSGISTLALVFRPGNSAANADFVPFPLPVNPADQSPRFSLPVSVPQSALASYRVVQRPSDLWLRSALGQPFAPQWLISVESPDLEYFWNQSVLRYNQALRTVRSVNRITLLPLIKSGSLSPVVASPLDEPNEASFQLSAEFLVGIKPNEEGSALGLDNLAIRPFVIKPLASWNGILRFVLNNPNPTIDITDPSLPALSYSATLSPIKDSAQDSASFGFQAELGTPADNAPSPNVRIGSLDLEFGGSLPPAPTPYEQTFQVIGLSPQWQIIPRLIGNMTLPILHVVPGGQDGLPASEFAPDGYTPTQSTSELCMDRRFNGSAPVVIPIGVTTSKDQTASFLLQVTESNPQLYSQTVSLTLSTAGAPSGVPQSPRVVVIDSDPFLVAAVDYPPLTGSNDSTIVALWNTGNPDGEAWQLQSKSQPFTLTLPPQGIGEEMPKATELGNKDKDPAIALDFRFSPSAPQKLSASYVSQNFADAPWNLRRILGFPGQRDAGAGVVQLNFELLYGLSCTVDSPLLRLAEIFSLIGRIAGRIPVPHLKKQPSLPAPTLSDDLIKQRYELKRWDWSLFAELYSKRVALFEPRASGSNYGNTVGTAGASAAPEVFTLSDGMSCTFRGAADLYYSVQPGDIAALDGDSFPMTHPKGLRGGVSWPFESPRIFYATVRNPKSSSAVASGLALSPLGGTGTIKAGFDQDLSTITSVTEIGRSSKVSVARLGRIGVFHNLARYVIEYERDTSVSAQFASQQTLFQNRPVLRKVREFVEILEPVATLSTSAQTFPGSGCIRSIEFKQRIIPVSGTWSSNVGNNGWKVPLWDRPASLPQNSVYKLPDIVFNFAGADSADVECHILSADKLFFYTETDAAALPDPHSWPVVSGVDFLPVPPPSANPAFPSSSAHEIPAYDPPTPFGLASFTHQIASGHGRINVVNGRGAQAIGANLGNVTLQRAPQAISGLQQSLQSIHDSVRTDLFNAVRGNPANVVNLAASVCAQATALKTRVINGIQGLVDTATSQEIILLQGWFKQFSQEINTVADEVIATLQVDKQVVGNTIDGARQDIIRAVNSEVDTFGERLDGLNASANALAKFFQRINQTLTGASQDLNDRKRKIVDALTAAGQVTIVGSQQIQQDVASIKLLLSAPLDRFSVLMTQVRTQVVSGAETWMPAATLVCHHWEGPIFQSLTTAQTVITQTDILLSYVNSGADDQISAMEQTITETINRAIVDVQSIAFPADILAASAASTADVQAFQILLSQLATSTKGSIDGYITKAAQNVKLSTIATFSDLGALINDIAQQIIAAADAGVIQPFQKQIDAIAKKYTTLLAAYASEASNEVCNAATSLQTAALNQLEAYRRTLEDAVGRLAESVAQALPPLDIQLPSGVSLPVLLNRAFGEVPSIPNLGFSLPNAAYFYLPSLPNVPLTPLLTMVKDLVPNLSPLSTLVPSFALSDRALPVPHLPNFDLNSIFPDFAGLKLTNLFPSLKMPTGSSDAVKITHGLDTGSRTAWIQADIDLKTDTATIFSAGPMALQIATPRFTSTVRAQAGANGQISKQASGAITGDWQLLIGGSPMITMRKTGLTFDNNGKLHVDVSPDRIELSAALSFIQQIIAQYTSPDSGFGIYPSATGIETRLSLPIPDTSMGTTGITNLTFNFLFGLSWANNFDIYAGFGLASPDAPFNLAVYILGGGGHLVATAHYRPGKSLTCQVDMALDASAALAISLGPIAGSVHVNLGMRFIFNSGQGDLSLGIFLLIGGEVSILSFVSANILLRLDATYSNGAFTCTGLFSISIKICWCFTLSVSEEVSCTLGSGSSVALLEDPLGLPWKPTAEESLWLPAAAISSVPSAADLSHYPVFANNYLQLIS